MTGLHAKTGEFKDPADPSDKHYYLDAGKSLGSKGLSKV